MNRVRLYLSAALLAVGSLVFSSSGSYAAETESMGIAGATPVQGAGGYFGVPGIAPGTFQTKSSSTPIVTNPVAVATATIVNASDKGWNGVVQFNATPIKMRDPQFQFWVHLDAGGSLNYPILHRNAVYDMRAIADTNASGALDAGDVVEDRDIKRTDKATLAKYAGKTLLKNIVHGTVSTTTTDPVDSSRYMKGTIAVENNVVGKTLTAATFNSTYFGFGNVPTESWGFVAPNFMADFGYYGAQVNIVATFSDGSTATNTVTGPANSTSAAVVWHVTSTSSSTLTWHSTVTTQGTYGYVATADVAQYYGQSGNLVIRLVSPTDTAAVPTVTDTVTVAITAPASATAPSVYVYTSGGVAPTPNNSPTGVVGAILNTPGKVLYSITQGTTETKFWVHN